MVNSALVAQKALHGPHQVTGSPPPPPPSPQIELVDQGEEEEEEEGPDTRRMGIIRRRVCVTHPHCPYGMIREESVIGSEMERGTVLTIRRIVPDIGVLNCTFPKILPHEKSISARLSVGRHALSALSPFAVPERDLGRFPFLFFVKNIGFHFVRIHFPPRFPFVGRRARVLSGNKKLY